MYYLYTYGLVESDMETPTWSCPLEQAEQSSSKIHPGTSPYRGAFAGSNVQGSPAVLVFAVPWQQTDGACAGDWTTWWGLVWPSGNDSLARSQRRTQNVRSGTRVPNAGVFLVVLWIPEASESFFCSLQKGSTLAHGVSQAVFKQSWSKTCRL